MHNNDDNGIKLLFVYTGHNFIFRECFDEEDEVIDGEEMNSLLETLFDKHPDIFVTPKNNTITFHNGIMENSSGNILGARILKGGLSLNDDNDPTFSIEEDEGLLLNGSVMAYIEIICDAEPDEGIVEQIVADIEAGVSIIVKCDDYIFESAESDVISVCSADDADKKACGFTGRYSPEVEQILAKFRQ